MHLPGGHSCICQVAILASAKWPFLKRYLGNNVRRAGAPVDCQNVASEPLATPSATSSPEAPASPTPDPAESSSTKHVKVVVSSDVPVDASIIDDNFDVSIGEEITGSKTYEFDIAVDSGLLVSAINTDMRGNVIIEVYANGQLKTQGTDSSGYAQISY